MPPARHLWLTLLLGLPALAAPAAAQDFLGRPQASDAFSWPRRAGAVVAGPWEVLELGSYRRAGETDAARPSSRSFLQEPPPAGPSRFKRFTRLAGMFMGRVSPLSLGSMRICFKIDIQ